MTASIQRDYYGYRAIYQRVLKCLAYKISNILSYASCMKTW